MYLKSNRFCQITLTLLMCAVYSKSKSRPLDLNFLSNNRFNNKINVTCYWWHRSVSTNQIRNTKAISVSVNLTSSLSSCDSDFLSLTIDSNLIRWKFKGFDFGSEQLQVLARAFSPCYIRIGGTSADFLTFDPYAHIAPSRQNVTDKDDDCLYSLDQITDQSDITLESLKKLTNFTMSGKTWEAMNQFFHDVGWDLMFDFNLFKWHNVFWDPSNAELLLNYSDARAYRIPAFQLGNEPNSFHYNFNFSIKPPILVEDFIILRKLISKYPRYKDSQLFGPDVTDLSRHSSSREYLEQFQHAGGDHVISEISLHQYYLNGRKATVEDFTKLSVLEKLKLEIEAGLNISQNSSRPLPIRFTETSSCFGGGAPGLSDAYVAGFLWLDKLGLSAKYGVTKVFRQTFYGGSYALLSKTGKPNPDYFLSVLHKWLILGPVFNVSITPAIEKLRIYAHCSRTDVYKYPKGSITLAYLNIGKDNHTISLSQFQNESFHLYSLTPGDSNGLKSRFVKLNGNLLKMSGPHLPPLEPSTVHGDITLPALTFGFIVIPKANVSLCHQHLASV